MAEVSRFIVAKVTPLRASQRTRRGGMGPIFARVQLPAVAMGLIPPADPAASGHTRIKPSKDEKGHEKQGGSDDHERSVGRRLSARNKWGL